MGVDNYVGLDVCLHMTKHLSQLRYSECWSEFPYQLCFSLG